MRTKEKLLIAGGAVVLTAGIAAPIAAFAKAFRSDTTPVSQPRPEATATGDSIQGLAPPSDALTSAAPTIASAPAGAAPTGSTVVSILKAGTRLTSGKSVTSPNGKYVLRQQTDGNLVLTDSANSPQWSAQTHDHPGAYTQFAASGELVVYGTDGKPLWHSGTVVAGTTLQVQNDGNAVILDPARKPLWNSQAERYKLFPGQALLAGQSRKSPDGRFTLAQYPDGNLALTDATGKPLWSAQTHEHPGSLTYLGSDGNLVVYGPDQKPLWQSATDGNPGASAIVQNDGNAVVNNSAGKGLWGSATEGVFKLVPKQALTAGQYRKSNNGKYTLVMYPDGNLALQGPGGAEIWATGSYGNPGAKLTLQPDGNLVIYNTAKTAVWNTRTTGGAYLLVQDDGNVVLYNAAKQALWATNTSR
jgi:hypothetical protein